MPVLWQNVCQSGNQPPFIHHLGVCRYDELFDKERDGVFVLEE
jgi:hypothetical protein